MIFETTTPTYAFSVPRAVDPKDLVGAHEIAWRIGRAHPNIVHAWHRDLKDFPKPIAHISAGKIWDWTEVEAWAKKTKRLK